MSETDAIFGAEYASIYDALYADKPYAAEVDAVLDVARRHGASPARVIDFGCGTGRHLVEFARHDLEVAGIDPSEAMLAAARRRLDQHGLDARLDVGRAADVEFSRRHDLATMLFAVLSYQSDTELPGALARVRDSLVPGGLFVADPWYGPAVEAEPPGPRTRRVDVDGVAWIRETSATHRPERRCVDLEFVLRRADTGDVAAKEAHTMRYFFAQDLERVLHRSGFELITLGRFPTGDALPSPPDEYPVMLIARAC